MQIQIKAILSLGVILFFAISDASALVYNYSDAHKKYVELNLRQPKTEEDGRIQTLNHKGAMSPNLDEATNKFINYAKGKKVLEIGGAYGRVMIEALHKNPTTIYHLFDIDERHLFIASNNLKNSDLDLVVKNNVKFIHGDIASDIDIDDKYDAILISRVLNFFSPAQLDHVLPNLYKLLKTGGKIYVVATTPYVKRYESFIPIYEKRVKDGDKFPGYIDNLKPWLNKELVSKAHEVITTDNHYMFFDKKVLKELFKHHGFRLLEYKYIPLPYFSPSWSLDGRENVILIADK